MKVHCKIIHEVIIGKAKAPTTIQECELGFYKNAKSYMVINAVREDGFPLEELKRREIDMKSKTTTFHLSIANTTFGYSPNTGYAFISQDTIDI